MKKLLIKVICLTAFLIMLIGFFSACNNYSSSKTGDIESDATMGVINITATEESRIPSTVKPTLRPTEKPTEAPTEKPTVIFSFEEVEEETVPPTQEVDNYVDYDYDYEYMNFEPEEEYKDEDYYYYNFEEEEESETDSTSSSMIYTPSDFQNMGIINWGDWTWTYYSEKLLPGEGLYLPGRHTDDNGYICDGDGYICIASSSLKWGTVVNTPFGKQGKVYDSGCASHILDVYVSW